MHWIDWTLVICSLLVVAFVGIKTQKYVKGVADFLSASRVAGRYVICVAGGTAGMGLISLVASFEVYYSSGLAFNFWSQMAVPLGVIFLLTGYCTYRYRETRAMTMGQFLEIRYSRSFRIFAGCLQSLSGVINYAIFPAVGARFLVYFCDLPVMTTLMGWTVPTFMVVMAIFLTVAVIMATLGGQITIIATDCIQGLLSYPLYAIIAIYLMTRFSWFNDIIPPMLADRPSGKSFIDPFDIHKLRNFNLFYVSIGVFSDIFNRMAWSGTQGYSSAARDAHEQKMGGVLGAWRVGFATVMYILLAVCAYAYLNNDNTANEARKCRTELATKVMEDISTTTVGVDFGNIRQDYEDYLDSGVLSTDMQRYIDLAKSKDQERADQIKASEQRWGLDKKRQEKTDAKTPEQIAQEKRDEEIESAIAAREEFVGVGTRALRGYAEETDQKIASQTFTTIFNQMRVPMALRVILPVGLMGLFCALCVFLLISTDTTYMHSWASIIVQDVVLPIRGRAFEPRQHLRLLRAIIAAVAVFAFCFSSFFSQVDFIIMFFAITGAIWLGGAGPCIVFGLYWKRATAAGAFTALITGSSLSVLVIILQSYWETGIYPWLEAQELVGAMSVWLESASAPFEPYIVWRMSPTKFPINSQEIFFATMLLSISLFVVVSLLTYKKPFNIDRMLHRGKYRREGEELVIEKVTYRNLFRKMLGIDSQYSRGDKILAWSVFIYSFWIRVMLFFVVVVVWNIFYSWPAEWWAWYQYITIVLVGIIIGAVSTVWFSIGGIRDLLRMFRDLAAKETNMLDDGRVIGHVSADDIALVEKVDHVNIEEAHIEEEILKEELEEEKERRDDDND